MDKNQSEQNSVEVPSSNYDVTPVAPQVQPSLNSKVDQSSRSKAFETLRHITAWTMISSAIVFALIGILATWEAFGPNTGDVIWRAFSSLLIIAFAALIVNVAARMAENRQ